MKTVLIDYGAGNLHSVHKALEKAGLDVVMTDQPEVALTADALVLPGQGHFRQVMEAFLASGFEPVVCQHISDQKPFLGICVGLQLLMEASEEAPGMPGLGIIKGQVKRFPEGKDSIPQMGWNQIQIKGQPALLKDIANQAFVYFANSYYAQFEEALPGADSSYAGIHFKSAVSAGPLNATQFHPEKSQRVGLRILENFKVLAEQHSLCAS